MSAVHTLEEVQKHNTEEDCWIIINNKVYDVSKFEDHPGGKIIITDHAGTDATEDFEAVLHSQEAQEQMKQYCIGDLSTGEKKVDGENKEKKPAQEVNYIDGKMLSSHCTSDDTWIMIDGKVYDVTKFKHPGGRDILITHSGKDATQEFEDIGHSQNARTIMEKYYIGEYKFPSGSSADKWGGSSQSKPSTTSISPTNILMLAVIGIAAIVFVKFLL